METSIGIHLLAMRVRAALAGYLPALDRVADRQATNGALVNVIKDRLGRRVRAQADAEGGEAQNRQMPSSKSHWPGAVHGSRAPEF